MSERTTILSLPLIQAGQAQKHITHNEAIRVLDTLVQPVAKDRTRVVPPEEPANGDRHIVATGATGAWEGKDGHIAVRQDQAWAFMEPSEGWQCHDLAAGEQVIFGPGGWAAPQVAGALLGLNAAADATNRLAVSADATLLTHDGGGHQLKINKADVTETNSLLFQTDWSGRAEMGCAGEDAFSVKVSADGSAWQTALSIDPTTAIVSGAAVQIDATDTATAKLARADLTYGPGTAVAPVAMAGGVPSGGLLEQGTTADGSFLKFADGTLICHHRLTLVQTGDDRLSADWSFPAAFAGGTADAVQATADGVSAAALTVDIRDLGGVFSAEGGNDSATIDQVLSGASTGAFDAADTLIVNVTATGRWA